MLCSTAAVATTAVVVATMLLTTTMTYVEAFAPTAPLRPVNVRSGGRVASLRMVYVPDGLTLEQWKKIKAKENEKIKEADLGRVGVRGFQSRSLQAWQEAGARHLFPVNPKKVNEYLGPTGRALFQFRITAIVETSEHLRVLIILSYYCRALGDESACFYQQRFLLFFSLP